jgi:hypothetical protein
MRNLGTKGLQAGRWAFGWVFLKKYQTKWPHNTRSQILALVNTSHGQNLPGAAGVLLILEYMICSRHHKPQECYHLSEQYVSQPNNQAKRWNNFHFNYLAVQGAYANFQHWQQKCEIKETEIAGVHGDFFWTSYA